MKEIDLDPVEYAPPKNIFIGADVFFVLAALSIINSLIVYFLEIRNLPIAFGLTQWVDGTTGPMTAQVGKFTLVGDGLCVGYDSGDAVSELYNSPGTFKGGTISFVTVNTGTEKYLDLEQEAARAFSKE